MKPTCLAYKRELDLTVIWCFIFYRAIDPLRLKSTDNSDS